jgi:hypothetical protein
LVPPTLRETLDDPMLRFYFREMLEREHSAEYVRFIEDVQSYRLLITLGAMDDGTADDDAIVSGESGHEEGVAHTWVKPESVRAVRWRNQCRSAALNVYFKHFFDKDLGFSPDTKRITAKRIEETRLSVKDVPAANIFDAAYNDVVVMLHEPHSRWARGNEIAAVLATSSRTAARQAPPVPPSSSTPSSSSTTTTSTTANKTLKTGKAVISPR